MLLDSTCYTGCAAPPTGIANTYTPQAPAPVAHTVSSLPFTGADLGEMFVIGLIVVVVGVTMWLSSRRRHV